MKIILAIAVLLSVFNLSYAQKIYIGDTVIICDSVKINCFDPFDEYGDLFVKDINDSSFSGFFLMTENVKISIKRKIKLSSKKIKYEYILRCLINKTIVKIGLTNDGKMYWEGVGFYKISKKTLKYFHKKYPNTHHRLLHSRP